MKKIKVMLVDDEPRFLRTTKVGLEAFGDLEVIIESNPETAAASLDFPDKWLDGYPDIFLLDIVMPYINGGRLARIIRDHEQVKDTPIVFYTASDRVVTREEVIKAGGRIGADDFITKGNLPLDELRLEILRRTGRKTAVHPTPSPTVP
jgi:CheY-like chemotaxis protein